MQQRGHQAAPVGGHEAMRGLGRSCPSAGRETVTTGGTCRSIQTCQQGPQVASCGACRHQHTWPTSVWFRLGLAGTPARTALCAAAAAPCWKLLPGTFGAAGSRTAAAGCAACAAVGGLLQLGAWYAAGATAAWAGAAGTGRTSGWHTWGQHKAEDRASGCTCGSKGGDAGAGEASLIGLVAAQLTWGIRHLQRRTDQSARAAGGQMWPARAPAHLEHVLRRRASAHGDVHNVRVLLV